MKDQKGLAAIVLIIATVFVVAGVSAVVIYINNNQSSIEPQVDQSQQQQQSQLTQDYPSLWIQAGLPEYPNGTVTKKDEGRNLNDGAQVTFTTSDTKDTVKAFYDTEMANRGFDLPATPDPSSTTYFGIYKKGSAQFTLQITTDDDGTRKVLVKYVEL
jgi:hypothetical protein